MARSGCEHLPIWPNHIGSFLIRDGEYSIHSNYYNYAFEYILEGNLKLFQRDQEFFAEAGDVCILHRGETNRFEPGSAGFARKLCVCMRGQLMTQLVASLGPHRILGHPSRQSPAHRGDTPWR